MPLDRELATMGAGEAEGVSGAWEGMEMDALRLVALLRLVIT